ncbi:hypothetical protein LCGC14_2222750, partial [marine sediment metagenome]
MQKAVITLGALFLPLALSSSVLA